MLRPWAAATAGWTGLLLSQKMTCVQQSQTTVRFPYVSSVTAIALVSLIRDANYISIVKGDSDKIGTQAEAYGVNDLDFIYPILLGSAPVLVAKF